MNPKGMTDAELIADLKSSGMSERDYAKVNGISRSDISNAKERLKKTPTAAALFSVDIGKPLTLTGDWLIVGDVHVPTTDYPLAQRVGKVASKLGIPGLIIAGDLFNFDLFSTYPRVSRLPGWKQERDAARQLLKEWLEVFERVVILPGNHDRRIQKWSYGELEEEDIFGMVTSSDKVRTNAFGWCTIKAKTGVWRVTHPRDYSRKPLNVAGTLAGKFHQHIISFHEHHLGISWSADSNIIVNGGGLFDPEKMAYTQFEDNTSPFMQRGFVALKDGYPMLFGREPFTRWADWD